MAGPLSSFVSALEGPVAPQGAGQGGAGRDFRAIPPPLTSHAAPLASTPARIPRRRVNLHLDVPGIRGIMQPATGKAPLNFPAPSEESVALNHAEGG